MQELLEKPKNAKNNGKEQENEQETLGFEVSRQAKHLIAEAAMSGVEKRNPQEEAPEDQPEQQEDKNKNLKQTSLESRMGAATIKFSYQGNSPERFNQEPQNDNLENSYSWKEARTAPAPEISGNEEDNADGLQSQPAETENEQPNKLAA